MKNSNPSRREREPVTVETIRAAHRARADEIRARLREFEKVWRTGTDERLWEEMVYCIFTAGASARMGLNSVEAVRPLLAAGSHEELAGALTGRHRYPRSRAGYVVATREFLSRDCRLRLRERLEGFRDPVERRDWLARERGVKGLGYKESSHFLRNVGLRGYAILDKHILRCLAEAGVIESPQPPATRSRYLATEESLRRFAADLGLDFDELDLVLWSMKTGEILK
ncbi:MAG TPA: N-glycosylase/DNA lyase [Pyrinomonadaceae bacterium]|nr:N-glycosylase/DNA lyase [Pyrinomonadaceae bacterium]